MGGLFGYDGPLLSFLSRVADLVILNLLTVLLCIPIITIGPAVTAAHYTALKLRRKEGYVLENFWKSFKENFKQSIGLGLIFAIEIFLAIIGFLLMRPVGGAYGALVQGLVLVFIIFLLFTILWTFPLQSKFVNTVPATIRNAFLLSVKYIFRTLSMLVVHLIPVFLVWLSTQLISVVVFLGFSLPIYLSAIIYDKVFEELEESVRENMADTQKNDQENSETPCLE